MRTRRANATVLTALLLASSVGAPLAAQSNETATLRVRVIDAATGQPIDGAQVGFPELALFQLANATGIAQIVGIPPGTRTLEVTMLGYGKASKMLLLEAHALAAGDIALTADPIEIEGLTVTTSAQIQRLRDWGFYNRERMGFGSQLGPLELASKIATRPSDYFYGIPSVELIPAGFGRKSVVSRRECAGSMNAPPPTAVVGAFGTSTGGGGGGSNAMAIYLDGVPYHDQLDRLPIDMIEAIEVYVGVQVPMQFSSVSGAHCGVILR